jgi:hypothetical protein
MASTTTLYTYTAIAQPLADVLADVVRRQVAAWGPTIDDTIAEMLVSTLAANGAGGEHHLIQGRADVWVWRTHKREDAPYVAAVEGPELHVHTFIPDAQPATLEALVERLLPRDDRN